MLQPILQLQPKTSVDREAHMRKGGPGGPGGQPRRHATAGRIITLIIIIIMIEGLSLLQ